MQDDKLLLILQKLSDIGERTARMEVEQRNMKEDLEEVKRQDSVQNQLLAEHISGVETQAARLDNEIKVREILQAEQEIIKADIAKLKEPGKFLSSAKQYILYIVAVGGAIGTIIGWFSK